MSDFRKSLYVKAPMSAALGAILICAFPALAEEGAANAKPLPVSIVETLNKLSGGPHPGYRANHAKGILVEGSFTPASGASSFSKAPHLAKPVPVIVRFSNGTGVPTLPDASPNASPHGMAIRFKLPGGEVTDIVSISANGFPVATPEDFYGLLTAISQSGPGAAKPSPIEQFLSTHPAAAKWVSTPRPAPESFGTLAFYGVNAFKFTNAKGVSRFARYQILPVAGEHPLSAEAQAKMPENYLMDELPQRIAKGPVKFRLVAQVAADGDVINDATAVWPADRPIVELGTISLIRVPKEQTQSQKALLFNPLATTAGIEPSNDPVLLFRPGVYAVSFGQRAN
jgi:catalase